MRHWDHKVATFLLFLFLVVSQAIRVGAAPVPVTSETEDPAFSSEERPEPALVVVFNRPIAVLRSMSFGYSPADRAKAISERIDKLIAQKIYGPVAAEAREEGMLISIGGQMGLVLMPGDVDSFARKTLEETAQETARLLKVALEEAELQTSAPYLLMAGAKSVGATILFIVVLVLIGRLSRRFWPRILALEQRLVDRIVARGFFFLAQLVRGIHWVIRLGLWVIILGITSEWLAECLKWFPYTRPWGEHLQENLLRLLREILGAALATLPNLLVIAVIVVITRAVAGVAKAFFSRVESGQVKAGGMDVEAARATRQILTVIVWLIAIVMIYPYIPGSNSAAFKGMSVFVGVLLSFGSSSVVGQFTSGLVLMYSHALRPGEYIRIGEHEGTVESLGFLSTKIRSPKNEEFHVPNAVILGTTIKNYSRLATEGGLLLHTTVTIGYDAPWRQVHALLIAAAKVTPGLCPEPAPYVLQTALSDFYVEYQLNACLAKPQDRVHVLAALHANIQDQFNTYGVQIMSPAYRQDKAQPVVVPKEKWYSPPAAPENNG